MARMKKNGKKDTKKQASALGLTWDVKDADHDWDRVQVLLDAFSGSEVERVMPPDIGLFKRTITDVLPGTNVVGKDTSWTYRESVRQTAEEITERLSGDADEFDDDEFNELVRTAIDEAAEGSYWVIYTHASLGALVFSDNWMAIDEALDDGIVDFSTLDGGFSKILTLAAYFAFRADVEQAMSLDD